MKRLVIKSFKDDLNGFLNLVPNRIKAINESNADPLPKEYGVNALALELHPSELELTVSDTTEITDGVRILSLVPDKKTVLPFFRAGQSINIKNESFSTPFSILSSPGSDKYEIAVFSDNKDNVSRHLYDLQIGSKIRTSGPEGFFYYISLRDKNTITAFCDNQGAPALISMAKSIADKTESYSLKIVYFDKDSDYIFRDILNNIPSVSAEYVADYSEIKADCGKAFVSGTESFCEACIQRLPDARINIVNPKQCSGETTEEFQCTVTFRDKKFVFTCKSNETLLSAFERNSVPSAAKCKAGECGYCRCKLVEGQVETVNIHSVDSLRQADKKYNFIHPCRSFAKSDLILAL
ncbi:MAG: 2Fe-2S iron-sulfur cluster binding domain-containing protein [Clostridia bacterium]|nr:2Fe-2S iron-sulfur cluster binding domain-containing protein [Clostridia bacterium]